MKILRDQPYPVAGGELTYDLVMPESTEPTPLVVCLHGGGWVSGDKSMYWEEVGWLAQAGFASACIEYRLAPLYPFPAPVEDVQSFVHFARSQADYWNIDPSKIASLGNSAGGHLALMAGLYGQPDRRVNAIVSICGITDLRDARSHHYSISMSFLEQFIPTIHEPNSPEAVQASPIHWIHPGAPPTILFHGSDDDVVPVDQSREFALALQEAGVETVYHELPGELHSFSMEAWLKIRATSHEFLKGVFCA